MQSLQLLLVKLMPVGVAGKLPMKLENYMVPLGKLFQIWPVFWPELPGSAREQPQQLLPCLFLELGSVSSHVANSACTLRVWGCLTCNNLTFFNNHRLYRYIAVHAAIAGFDVLDFFNHVHAVNDLAKDGVTPTLWIFAGMVEEIIVADVYEKLGSG